LIELLDGSFGVDVVASGFIRTGEIETEVNTVLEDSSFNVDVLSS